jgi:hypothetical protein
MAAPPEVSESRKNARRPASKRRMKSLNSHTPVKEHIDCGACGSDRWLASRRGQTPTWPPVLGSLYTLVLFQLWLALAGEVVASAGEVFCIARNREGVRSIVR